MNPAGAHLNFRFHSDELLRHIPEPPPPLASLKALEAIQQQHSRKVLQPPETRTQQAYHFFFNRCKKDIPAAFDTPRFARRLAWALAYREDQGEQIVTSPRLGDALVLIGRYPHAGALLGVFDALLRAWDTTGAPLLRQFIARHLPAYHGKRRLLRQIQTNLKWYTSEYGPRQLATDLIYRNIPLHQVWEYTVLPDSMRQHTYFGAVGWAYVLHFLRRRLDATTLADILGFVEIYDVDATSKAILSALIEHLGEETDSELQLPIQAFALKQWGDPRVNGSEARWYGMSERAARTFRSWITREDLLFFFDVVAQMCHDPKFAYRKAFWLSYLPYIHLCRPVLHRDAELFFAGNHKALQYLKVREPAQLTGGTRSQHAFIIQMGEFVFVEFSTAGACYVYRQSDERLVLDQTSYEMSDLRDQEAAIHRQEHIGSERSYWQQQLSAWIEEHANLPTPLPS